MSIVIQSVIAFVNCCSFARPSTGAPVMQWASSDQPRYSWLTWLRSTEAKAASSRRLKPRPTRWRSKRSWTCAGSRSCIGLAVEEPFQPLPSGDMPLMNHWCTKYRGRA